MALAAVDLHRSVVILKQDQVLPDQLLVDPDHLIVDGGRVADIAVGDVKRLSDQRVSCGSDQRVGKQGSGTDGVEVAIGCRGKPTVGVGYGGAMGTGLDKDRRGRPSDGSAQPAVGAM